MRHYFTAGLLLSCILYGFGQSKPAKAYFEESKKLAAQKEMEKALSSIDLALKTDSLNRTYLLHKADLLYDLSRCREGIVTLQKLVEHENQFDDITISYYADLLDCAGLSEKATQTFLEYINENPSEASLTKLAQRFYKLGQPEKAIQYYRQVVDKNPRDVEAVIDLSKMLYGTDQKEAAKSELLKALKANKDNIQLLNYLASYYLNEDDMPSAIATADQIIKLSYTAENIASRALFYERGNQPEKAYEDYKRILALSKCNPDYYSKLLAYELAHRMYAQLVENSHKAIACDSKNERYYLDGLYTALLFLDRKDEGVKYLNKQLDNKPANFNPYYFKAILLINDGDYSQALKYIPLALGAKDIDRGDVIRIKTLQLGTLLLQENYQEFAAVWKQSKEENLTDAIEFSFQQSQQQEKTTLKSVFNKDSGAVESTLIIPAKIFEMLRVKYNVDL